MQEILQSHSLVFLNLPNIPIHRCFAVLSTVVPIAVHLRLSLAPCSLPTACCAHDIPQASLSPNPTPLRVKDGLGGVRKKCHVKRFGVVGQVLTRPPLPPTLPPPTPKPFNVNLFPDTTHVGNFKDVRFYPILNFWPFLGPSLVTLLTIQNVINRKPLTPLCESGRRSWCPHSLLQRSSAGLP